MSEKYDARALAVEYMRRNKDKLTAGEYLVKVLELERTYATYIESKESEKVMDTWATLGRES
ncbi:hypothetical protein ACNFJN_08295 [Xenorhabdus budapestensis]|uniref:hypothetical protein n=1 Tax=Xenorhabdus budapestensis TaxID=290110 RepID=UPI003A88418B